MLVAVLLSGISLEGSSLVIYQSDSDTKRENVSSSSSDAGTSGKRVDDLASFLLRLATAQMNHAYNSSSRQKVAAQLRYVSLIGDQAKLAELLLDPDIDICQTDELGNTALHYAAASGKENLLKILLDYAKKHNIDARVVYPLQKMSTERAWDYANIVKNSLGEENLKEYGAYLEPDPEKISGTVGGLIERFLSIFLEPDDKIKKRNDPSSLASIPFIDVRNIHMATALHYAVEMGHINCVRLLLEYQANLELCASDHKGSCRFHPGRPLHIACFNRHKEIAMLLLKRKADFKALDGTKKSPLHAAARGGCRELIQELLDRGAREFITDAEGKTPVQYAYESGHYALVADFLTYRGDVNNFDEEGLRPIHFAAMADDCALADRLEKEGALLSPFDNNGFAPVHYAAKMGCIKMLDWCLDRVPYLSDSYESILCTAARACQKDSVKRIIRRAHEIQPYPINIHSDTGLTRNGRAMSYALWGLEERLPQFIELLIDEGTVAPVKEETISRDLWKPIDERTTQVADAASLVRDLWEELGKKSNIDKAYPRLETDEGATPLHLAAEKEHKELFAIIIKSIIAHELLRECKKDFNELELYFDRHRTAAYEKEVERINQRNAEARVKGYTEQEVPPLEPFDWKKDLEEKVLAQEKNSHKRIIEQYDDLMIWKIMSASCWLAIRDEDEELSEDIIRLVERSIKERILPLVKEERFRKVLIERVRLLVNGSLSKRGNAGIYADLSPSQCVVIKVPDILKKAKEESKKAQTARDNAKEAAEKEEEHWRLSLHCDVSTFQYHSDQEYHYRNEKEKWQRHVDYCSKRAEEFNAMAEASRNYKDELEDAAIVEKICKDWLYCLINSLHI